MTRKRIRKEETDSSGSAGDPVVEEDEVEEEEEDIQGNSSSSCLKSINIFRKFIKTCPTTGELDATEVVSLNCYLDWLSSRRSTPCKPEKAFQRSLIGHLTGVDGRVPFSPVEEEAILKIIRKKQRWECFSKNNNGIKFGESGFRTKGFYEKTLSGEVFQEKSKKRAKEALERIQHYVPAGTITIGGNVDQSLAMKPIKVHGNKGKKRASKKIVSEGMDSTASTSPNLATSKRKGNQKISSPNRNSIQKKRKASTEEEDQNEEERVYAHIKQERQRKNLPSPSMISYNNPQQAPPTHYSSVSSSSLSSHHQSEQTRVFTETFSPDVIADNQLAPMSTPFSTNDASNVVTAVMSAILKFISLGISSWWGSSLQAGRMMLLAKGWFSRPTMQRALELQRIVELEYPSQYVLIYDLTSPDYTKRVMSQNLLSIELFGRMAAEFGGFSGRRFPVNMLWKLLPIFGEAALGRGNGDNQRWLEQDLVEYFSADGQSLRTYKIFVRKDTESSLIIERGYEMRGIPPKPVTEEIDLKVLPHRDYNTMTSTTVEFNPPPPPPMEYPPNSARSYQDGFPPEQSASRRGWTPNWN